MTNTPAKQGVRARERNALERITQIESDLTAMVGAVQQALQTIEARIGAQSEILDAVIQEIGSDQINSRIEATRAARAVEQADTAKEGLKKALDAGELAPAAIIGEKSVITGVEHDSKGELVPPGYVQLGYNTVKPEFQEKMLGQPVGFKFETAEGTFEITGIYDVVEKPVEVAIPSDTK